MGKLKHISIKTSAILFMIGSIIIAALLSFSTMILIDNEKNKISDFYMTTNKQYYLTTAQGERLGDGVGVSVPAIEFSKRDQRKLTILTTASFIIVPVYFIVCMMLAAFLFYRLKLKKPLALLENATKKITAQDLDFKVNYPVQDEMGKLCMSFEKMRELAKNYQLLWRTAEERKRLNAAFSHDLRTPLTVLKGYSSFLLKHAQDDGLTLEKVSSTAQTMQQHIGRLEGYVTSMNTVLRLEQMEAARRNVTQTDLLHAIKDITQIIDTTKIVSITNLLKEEELYMDLDVILQVYKNLLANALRYTNTSIQVNIMQENHQLYLIVEDDGGGFSNEALARAKEPYYRNSGKQTEDHLGLGLYICYLLCEKYHGYLQLKNGVRGAQITAAFSMAE